MTSSPASPTPQGTAALIALLGELGYTNISTARPYLMTAQAQDKAGAWHLLAIDVASMSEGASPAIRPARRKSMQRALWKWLIDHENVPCVQADYLQAPDGPWSVEEVVHLVGVESLSKGWVPMSSGQGAFVG